MIYSPEGLPITKAPVSGTGSGGLLEIADYWNISWAYLETTITNREEFIQLITEKMKKTGTLCGYVRAWACIKNGEHKASDIYHILMFINKQGEVEGQLLYVDGYELKSVPISSETVDHEMGMLYLALRENLGVKIARDKYEAGLRKNFGLQLRRKLFSETASDNNEE